MAFQGFFVDDKDAAYADILSKEGELEIKFVDVANLMPLARDIVLQKPDIVVLDYRLDESAKIDPAETYKGSALAQPLRDAAIAAPSDDFALVLLSAEDNIRALYRPDWTAHDLFDRVYTKGQVNQDDDAVRAELLDLCAAYKRLRECEGKFDLFELSGIEKDDVAQIDFQELRQKISNATAPHLVVQTFLKGLILRSGPLLNEHDLAARMGVETKSLGPIVEALDAEGARYGGILNAAWPRWWAYKVDSWSEAIFKRRFSSLPASTRTAALSERLGTDIPPAKSPWNDKDDELLAVACACCRRPTEIRHSLSVFDSVAPRHLSARRVCWDCVQLGTCENNVEPLVIADTDAALAEEVLKMNRKLPKVPN